MRRKTQDTRRKTQDTRHLPHESKKDQKELALARAVEFLSGEYRLQDAIREICLLTLKEFN